MTIKFWEAGNPIEALESMTGAEIFHQILDLRGLVPKHENEEVLLSLARETGRRKHERERIR
jgi:hypothetical protein